MRYWMHGSRDEQASEERRPSGRGGQQRGERIGRGGGVGLTVIHICEGR